MPNIEAIPDEMCLYNALDPYHVNFDNKPLQNIIARQKMINTAVDYNTNILASAKGSTGSLADRLDASLQDSGHLIPAAVDFALHSIEEHTDSADYVRMTDLERDKLSLVADGATNISLSFESAGVISGTSVDFSNGIVVLADSVSTSWRWTTGKMYLDVVSAPASHIHFYDQEPAGTIPADYINYSIPSFADPTTVRVYINGCRVSLVSGYVPVANSTGILSTWTLNSISITANGFALTSAITQYDLITVDYDRLLS
jgi:hypothetical protein